MPIFVLKLSFCMNKRSIVIGTRGSKLALWQANYVKSVLEKMGHPTTLKIIKTKGDKIQHLSFDKIEGKGFFTKELEDALLQGVVDVAVHSMKDMPTTQPEGLVLAGVSSRANDQDWVVIRKDKHDKFQPFGVVENGTIGTSSARRKAFVKHYREDINLADIRGNVPTRLKKLEEGNFDAIILAGAGLTRLEIDLSAYEVVKLNAREFVPAPAQGVMTFQCAEADLTMRKILFQLHDGNVSSCTNVERGVLKMMGGGCHVPLGVNVKMDQYGYLHGRAAYAPSSDEEVRFASYSSSTSIGMAEEILKMLKG